MRLQLEIHFFKHKKRNSSQHSVPFLKLLRLNQIYFYSKTTNQKLRYAVFAKMYLSSSNGFLNLQTVGHNYSGVNLNVVSDNVNKVITFSATTGPQTNKIYVDSTYGANVVGNGDGEGAGPGHALVVFIKPFPSTYQAVVPLE